MKKNKSVAIVGLGNSFSEYILAKIRSEKFDEVWTINSMSSAIYHDKCFMMDPPSRFLDTPNAGKQLEPNGRRAERLSEELAKLQNARKATHAYERRAHTRRLIELKSLKVCS